MESKDNLIKLIEAYNKADTCYRSMFSHQVARKALAEALGHRVFLYQGKAYGRDCNWEIVIFDPVVDLNTNEPAV